MSGFPLRHLLQSFGSRLRDARPIEHPELEVSAARLNLGESIAAASSLLLPRAVLVAQWNVASQTFTIFHQEEAWNLKHEQAHPTLAQITDGAYSYTFASSYLDNDGVSVPTVLPAARLTAVQEVSSGGGAPTYSTGTELRPDGVTVEFFIRNSADELINRRFWLEVF